MQADQKATEKFLDILFRELPGQELEPGVPLRISIWSTPSKHVTFHLTAESAAAKVAELTANGENVYFGVGLTGEMPKKGRGKKANVGALYFLWADIDFDDGSEAHKPKKGGKQVPPSIEAAKEILKDVGLPASLVVHSGHGLQAYWLLSEPILIHNKAERDAAEKCSQSWVDTARSCARKRGCDLDAVHDLTRVFRVVGSANVKIKDDPKPVQTIYPARGKPKIHERGTVEAFVVPGEYSPNSLDDKRKVVTDVDVVIPVELTKERMAELQELADAMSVNDDRFKKTINRERTDLNDQSASGYDLAVASQMAMASCEDQDIADMMLFWRLKHNEDTAKVSRRDYLMGTLGKAKYRQQKDIASVQMADITASAPQRPVETPRTEEQKDQVEEWERSCDLVMAEVRKAMGVNVVKCIQHGRENSEATYSFVLGDGRDVVVGSAGDLLNQSVVRQRLLPTGIFLEDMKRGIWHNTVRSLTTFAEIVEDETTTTEYMGLEWVREYFVARTLPAYSDGQWRHAVAKRAPFYQDNVGCLNLTDFKTYVDTTKGIRIPVSKLREILRAIGFKAMAQPIQVRLEKGKASVRYWKGPASQIRLDDIIEDQAPAHFSGMRVVSDKDSSDGDDNGEDS